MSKFAKVSCSLGHQELDLFYYSVECDQLTKWAESDSDQKDQRIKEVARVFKNKPGCSYIAIYCIFHLVDNSFFVKRGFEGFVLKVQIMSKFMMV